LNFFLYIFISTTQTVLLYSDTNSLHFFRILLHLVSSLCVVRNSSTLLIHSKPLSLYNHHEFSFRFKFVLTVLYEAHMSVYQIQHILQN